MRTILISLLVLLSFNTKAQFYVRNAITGKNVLVYSKDDVDKKIADSTAKLRLALSDANKKLLGIDAFNKFYINEFTPYRINVDTIMKHNTLYIITTLNNPTLIGTDTLIFR